MMISINASTCVRPSLSKFLYCVLCMYFLVRCCSYKYCFIVTSADKRVAFEFRIYTIMHLFGALFWIPVGVSSVDDGLSYRRLMFWCLCILFYHLYVLKREEKFRLSASWCIFSVSAENCLGKASSLLNV